MIPSSLGLIEAERVASAAKLGYDVSAKGLQDRGLADASTFVQCGSVSL
jgi:hypothetical protein